MKKSNSNFNWLFIVVIIVIATLIKLVVRHDEFKRSKQLGAEMLEKYSLARALAELPDDEIPKVDVQAIADKVKQNSTISNRIYTQNNREKLKEASTVYGFVNSLKYKYVDFCKRYYPVNTLEREYNKHFATKKEKAKSIIIKAGGQTALESMDKVLYENRNLYLKQVESDYVMTRQDAQQEGIPDLTKAQFCQFIDEATQDIILEEDKRFRSLFPNF